MNFKTTIVLGAIFVGLAAFYVVVRSAPKPAESSTTTAPTPASSPTSHDLFEKKLGDVVKVVCQVRGKEAWTFEKQTPIEGKATPTWRMTSPTEVAVAA